MSNPDYKNSQFLEPGNMIRLYASGAFPMADSRSGKINWYMPDVRTIIPLNQFNIPRSLKKKLHELDFEIKFDTNFPDVVKACANRDTTWISDELIKAYMRLHKRGYIHTVETWKDNELVGGLYGISFRGAFFGESMFSRVSQASKAALSALINHLVKKDFVLLDVQYKTSHLEMFGAKEIPFTEYQNLLYSAYVRGCEF
jgi:leucyl/phenylalanyl-tRNA--protein transferase